MPEDRTWIPPSWDQVVEEHATRTYRLAYRLTGNPHDAEDLTQETFVRVFRSLDAYQPVCLSAWIHRITVNLFLDTARRRARIYFDSLGDEASRISDPGASPEQQYEVKNFDYDIQLALDSLPPDFRVAVVLSDIEGYSYEEIAAIVDAKVGTVGSRIYRARAHLRRALAHRAPATVKSRRGAKTYAEVANGR
ncbi:MAG: sigma-70 family RNA polymerase sigma factor [Bifidobacteriaceae bacterium]|jgi:RNA polymerase sigma-70 factor (ECF subfamily)|nr:sigma-70 family RNA polymerase sigma factor [Bifidobacteriaceae bacterium]